MTDLITGASQRMLSEAGSCVSIMPHLQACKCPVVSAHDRADGDALGSALAMAMLLRNVGFDARLSGLVPFPQQFNFMLSPAQPILNPETAFRGADLLIMLDCASIERCSPAAVAVKAGVPIIVIDHHQTDPDPSWCLARWVNPGAAATGEMVWHFARSMGIDIDADIARALWISIATDTGQFSYENTTPSVLRCASDLLATGFDLRIVNECLYQTMLVNEWRITGRAIQHLEIDPDGKIATTWLSPEDYTEFGCMSAHSQQIVNIPRSVDGVQIGLFAYRAPDSPDTKVSVRSRKPYDASILCAKFNGGGHERAAGCNIDYPVNEALALVKAAAREMVDTQL